MTSETVRRILFPAQTDEELFIANCFTASGSISLLFGAGIGLGIIPVWGSFIGWLLVMLALLHMAVWAWRGHDVE